MGLSNTVRSKSVICNNHDSQPAEHVNVQRLKQLYLNSNNSKFLSFRTKFCMLF